MDNLFKKIVAEEKNAKEFGFYWETIEQLIDQIKSECKEIKQAFDHNDEENLKEELGDLMHAAICLCVFFNFDPEKTLKDSIDKFQLRYSTLVKLVQDQGLSNLQGKSMDILLSFWDQAKLLTKK
jgi:uncharacterized protein YabN with tetrapyrrole methylase and pyrophosphatase domain